MVSSEEVVNSGIKWGESGVLLLEGIPDVIRRV